MGFRYQSSGTEANRVGYIKMNVRISSIIIALFISAGLLYQPVFAKSSDSSGKFPRGCVSAGHDFDLYNVLFKPSAARSDQTVYFIYNHSREPVYLLDASETDKPYVMYNNGNVKPNLWSVFAVTKDKAKFICTTFDRDKKMHHVLDCKKYIKICEFRRAHFGSNHRGTYWIAVNKTRSAAISMAKNYGIWLNAPTYSE